MALLKHVKQNGAARQLRRCLITTCLRLWIWWIFIPFLNFLILLEAQTRKMPLGEENDGRWARGDQRLVSLIYRKQKFLTSYTDKFPCFIASAIDKYHARCTICKTDIALICFNSNISFLLLTQQKMLLTKVVK